MSNRQTRSTGVPETDSHAAATENDIVETIETTAVQDPGPPSEPTDVAEEVVAAAAEAVAEATTTSTTTAPTDYAETESGTKILPTFRDVILGEGSAGHRTNLLLQDMMRLYRMIWKIQDKSPPTTREEASEIAEKLFALVKHGKKHELAGLKDVPKPFMKSQGRFLERDGKDWTEISDTKAKDALASAMVEEFKLDDLGDLTQMPFIDFKGIMERESEREEPLLPQAKDAVLFKCDDVGAGEKMYEQQNGNKAIFNLASQLVTTFTRTSEKRVEAALLLLKGLDEAELHDEDREKVSAVVASRNSRFLVREMETETKIVWSLLNGIEAAEFALIFIFEVFLEKEIHLIAYNSMGNALDEISAGIATLPPADATKPGTEPIPEPTEYDVLFGRGGMTNSHAGNRRFRDVIALHRPDYVRAIKMDKPGVARKIVRAIRNGSPPGRFLKKHDDGKWYDVGDRTAAEKTSQGLRERSNAEKRQRQALREALRVRKDDDEDNDDEEDQVKKKQKTTETAAAAVGTLNYGTTIGSPLSLNAKEGGGKRKASAETGELATAGLPPNAVDEEGNILVTDYDILAGRGGLTNHHRGNKRFRDIVALHRPDYMRAPKVQKPSVARVIVRAIRNGDPPGRFLKKDEKTGKWIDIGDKKAAEKTSQALREKTTEERDKVKDEPSGLGVNVLLPDPSSYLAAVAGSPLILPATVQAPVVRNALETQDENEIAVKGERETEQANTVEDPTKAIHPEEQKTKGSEDVTNPDRPAKQGKNENAEVETAMV